MNLKCRAETADKDADTSAALVVIMFKQRIGVSDLLGESSRALVLKPIDRVEKIAGLLPLACSCC